VPCKIHAPNIAREHLLRVHTLCLRCRRCWISFDDQYALEEHYIATERCRETTCPFDISEHLDARQLNLLKQRQKQEPRKSEEEKWRDIYRIIYPNEDDIEIPEPCEYLRLQSDNIGAHKNSDYEAATPLDQHMRRENPGILIREIQNFIEQNYGPLDLETRDKIADIPAKAESETKRMYYVFRLEMRPHGDASQVGKTNGSAMQLRSEPSLISHNLHTMGDRRNSIAGHTPVSAAHSENIRTRQRHLTATNATRTIFSGNQGPSQQQQVNDPRHDSTANENIPRGSNVPLGRLTPGLELLQNNSLQRPLTVGPSIIPTSTMMGASQSSTWKQPSFQQVRPASVASMHSPSQRMGPPSPPRMVSNNIPTSWVTPSNQTHTTASNSERTTLSPPQNRRHSVATSQPHVTAPSVNQRFAQHSISNQQFAPNHTAQEPFHWPMGNTNQPGALPDIEEESSDQTLQRLSQSMDFDFWKQI
jgi:hypothetical protein